MNKKSLLARLKSLEKKRGDISAFRNHDEFLLWSDQVAPLLAFDEILHRNFQLWVSRVKSAHNLGHDHREGLGEAIGVANQAITKLEIEAEHPADTPVESQKSVEYPEKVTLSWLYKHVPVKLWISFVAILLTAFSLGLAFSETKLYGTIKGEIHSSQEKSE
jgi:hypothetical protein